MLSLISFEGIAIEGECAMTNFSRYYRRDGTPYKGVLEWAADFENDFDKVARVAKDQIGPYFVSTVCLGIDHNFSGVGPPIIFETMIAHDNGQWLHYQERYSTEEEAKQGHAKAVLYAKELVSNDAYA